MYRIDYEYDDKGRLVTKTTSYIPPENVEISDLSYDIVKEVETYFYGDYYMYGEYTR